MDCRKPQFFGVREAAANISHGRGTYSAEMFQNDKQYASYVNDGHDVDKHFVPGLYVDDEGVLSMDPARDVGMVVGTKTKYVEGLYMKEAGVDKYKEVAEKELGNLAKEMFR